MNSLERLGLMWATSDDGDDEDELTTTLGSMARSIETK